MRRIALRGSLLGTAVAMVVAAALGAAPATGAPAPEPCGELEQVVIAGHLTCSHGGDEAVHDEVVPMSERRVSALAAADPAPCPGNGRSGRRIRVFLGYPADTNAPNTAPARSLIRDVLALTDANLDASSPGVIGQHYRLWCQNDTSVTITVVKLKKIGYDDAYTFQEVANSLNNAGYNKPAFVYSVFVANIGCCYPYGGQGSLAVDDQVDPDANANNAAFARYSMIRFDVNDAATSLAIAFQHEVGHNLGAVQNSAPHSSGAYHCYETYDVMCYNDGGSYFRGGGALVNNCPSLSVVNMYVFDCGNDDYYNAEPGAATYLSDHWNVAESSWLTPPGSNGL